MKKTLLIVLVATAMVACKKKSDDTTTTGSSNDATITSVKSEVSQGTWRITKFVDSGNDETASFNGYNFTFMNGSLSATNGSSGVTGNWSVTDSNSSDDSPGDVHFNISISSGNAFDELTEDWHFLSHSSSKIELIDESGGNGGTDYLTFEKN